MSNVKGTPTFKYAELRKRAQVYLSTSTANDRALSQDEVKRLVYELETYQAELEMQNKDLRNAQEELEQSRHKYTDLYDFAPVGYLTVSAQGFISEANLTAADMLGSPRGLLIQQTLSSFFTTVDEKDRHYLCKQRLLATKDPRTCESRLRRKDGRELAVSCKCVVNPEIDGDSNQFRMIIIDITERKKVEAELAEHREHLEEMIKKRTAELQENIDELERFSQLACGREEQMITLKKEVNSLRTELGREEKYTIV